ncbi:MAG: beta-phosphoglucomutase [Treponema sp.]|jgi:beta-phosphoglucomutase|nr:beta-phosphoglucomutase [Treponema sp.]
MMKGIIFDLDGVLVFTDKFHYQAWKYVADELGAPFDETLNNRLRGVSRMESLEIILSNAALRLSKAEKERVAEQKNNSYRKLLQTLTPQAIDRDTRKTLNLLRERGLKLAIGSSSKNAPLILEKTGLAEFFDAVSDGNNITHSKPDPEVFLKAAEFLGLEPYDCTVVEDAKAGIDAAKAGGFTAIGIDDAAGYTKCDQVINRLSELVDLIWGVNYEYKNDSFTA